MAEIDTIIETVENQAAARETGCLSMRSERLLVAEIKRLRSGNSFDPNKASQCGHPDCQTWRTEPCGQGCYWSPKAAMRPEQISETRAHYRKHPLPVTFERAAR